MQLHLLRVAIVVRRLIVLPRILVVVVTYSQFFLLIPGRYREDRHGGPESEQGGHQDSGLVPWPQGSQRSAKLNCLSADKRRDCV